MDEPRRPTVKVRMLKFGFYRVGDPLEFEEIEIPPDDPDYEYWLELQRSRTREFPEGSIARVIKLQ